MPPSLLPPMLRALTLARDSAILLPPRTAVLKERFMDLHYKCGKHSDVRTSENIPIERHLKTIDRISRSGKGLREDIMEYMKGHHLLPGEALTYNMRLWARYELEEDEGGDGFGTSAYPSFGSLIMAYAHKKIGTEGAERIRLKATNLWYLYGLPNEGAEDGLSSGDPVFIDNVNEWSARNPGVLSYDRAWTKRPKRMSFVLYQGLIPLNEEHPERRVATRKGHSGFRAPDGGVFSLDEFQVSGLFRGKHKR